MSTPVLPVVCLCTALCATGCGDDVPDGATAFGGTDVALASGDLDPLWKLVGDARLIGLGESLHTSGGFYAAKDRLIRTLIEHHDVRVVAMETPRARARKLDAYLTSGSCDHPDVEVFDRVVFEVFLDNHTYALMRWICERNAASPDDPVHLFGFDVQQPDTDSEEIRTFLEAWAPDDAPGLLAGIAACAVTYADTYPSAADHAACTQGLGALEGWLTTHAPTLIASAGAYPIGMLRVAITSFRAAQDHYYLQGFDFPASYQPRDVGMAAVFEGVLALDYPADARVAIWAHNVHLARNHDRVTDSIYAPGAVTFGTAVTRAFGDDYAAVALTGFAPGANWPQVDLVEDRTDFGTARSSVERQLHDLGEPYLIVDPRASFLRPTSARLLSEETMIPSEQFTAIVYLDRSPPMDAVFW